MSFFEERFPSCIKFGVTGGPRFSTSKATSQNGFTSKQRNWLYPLQSYQADNAIKNEADFEAVRAFFYNVYGGFDGFRFKDWSDYKVADGQCVIITHDDDSKQLARAYTYGARTFIRPITKPVPGTVVGELERRYSVAWQKCEPGNAVAQAACILERPPSAPVVGVGTKPAKRTLVGVLQQASERATEPSAAWCKT